MSNAKDMPIKSLPRADLLFADKYVMGDEVLGRSSAVRKATERFTGREVMVKRFNREKLSKADMKELRKEVAVLRKLDFHDNIFRLYDFFADSYEVYVVTDLVEGDDLFERIVKKEIYTEKEARNVIKTLLEAVQHAHARGVAHCDINPQNILFTSKSKDATLKLTSFGLAQQEGIDSFTIPCGTPAFIAPEIATSLVSFTSVNYTKAIDIWALGVVSYTILCGYLPIYNRTEWNLYKRISQGDYTFAEADWSSISNEAKHFITRMLVVDPLKRATADELLQDPWIQNPNLPTTPLNKVKLELREFNARRSFKAAIHTVKAALSMARIVEVNEEEDNQTD